MERLASASTTGEEYLILAQVYVERGDADSAIEAYQKAANQAPEWFEVAKRQGLYLLGLNLKPQAEVALRSAYRLNDEDEQVAAGLRKLGVVPGPALKDENELAKPIIPKGPLPPLLKPQPREPLPTAGGPTPSAAPAD